MMINPLNNKAVLAMSLMFGVVAMPAHATILAETCAALLQISQWIVLAGYGIAGISLAKMAIATFATGKFQMGSFISWGGSLFLMAFIPSFMNFLTQGNFSTTC